MNPGNHIERFLHGPTVIVRVIDADPEFGLLERACGDGS